MSMADPTYGQALSMLDIARATGADGKYISIIEILNETNPILQDLRSVQANSGMVHVAAVRTGLPEGTYRAFYQGVESEKATVTQIQESTSMLESFAQPDKALIDLHRNRGDIMLQQTRGFIEGLGQTQARTIFYGNPAIAPNEFRGLTTRYSSYGITSSTGAAVSGVDKHFYPYNVISMGGTGTNLTSIWVIEFGADKIFGIYPQNSTAGLNHEDLGQQLVLDSAGKQFLAYTQHYSWRLGLVVADWRSAVRICNIDTSAYSSSISDANANALGDVIFDAIERLPNHGRGAAVYCSPRMHTAFNKIARNRLNLALSLAEWNGQVLPSVNGMMFKVCDAISEHETVVSAYSA